jgi:hypothetical protein
MSMKINKAYLGSNVYASIDEYDTVTLTVEEDGSPFPNAWWHPKPRAKIVLERDDLEKLVRLAKGVFQKPEYRPDSDPEFCGGQRWDDLYGPGPGRGSENRRSDEP